MPFARTDQSNEPRATILAVKIAAWLFCASAVSAQTVTLTGSVTNANTHEPIQAVTLGLYSNSFSSGAHSDASGRFRIPSVKAGGYRLVASRTGFEGVTKQIRIEAGADPPALDLTMLPWPGVRGTVFDSQRQPIGGVRVRAINPGNAPGVVDEAITDGGGRYALQRLTPGQYHFLAMPPVDGSATEPMELAPTWFPSATDQHDAPPVSLRPGDDLLGFDIVLRTVPVFRLSGKVVDERGEPASGATVETGLTERKTTARDDGSFDLMRVRPGDGALRANWQRGAVKLRGFAKVAVRNHDIEDLVLRVAPPVSVSGQIELDGQPRHRCEGDASLMPVDGQGEKVYTGFGESGIRFESVYLGRYRLSVEPGWKFGRHYLDSVWLGERDITVDELEVVPGMMPFRVVPRTGGGRLRGAVEDGNGGAVVLTPREERLRFRPFILVVPLEGRTFAIDNARPGEYYAFAFQGSFNSDEMQNPTYALPYLEGATIVRLERDSTATVTVRYAKVSPW
jgi:hypothetical protein